VGFRFRINPYVLTDLRGWHRHLLGALAGHTIPEQITPRRPQGVFSNRNGAGRTQSGWVGLYQYALRGQVGETKPCANSQPPGLDLRYNLQAVPRSIRPVAAAVGGLRSSTTAMSTRIAVGLQHPLDAVIDAVRKGTIMMWEAACWSSRGHGVHGAGGGYVQSVDDLKKYRRWCRCHIRHTDPRKQVARVAARKKDIRRGGVSDLDGGG